MDKVLHDILTSRHYAVSNGYKAAPEKVAYYNAYLLANFGIIVNRPELLTSDIIEIIAESYKLSVPASFYSNPQDTKYFTSDELLVEQLVSYLLIELTCVADYNNPEKYNRQEVFKKTLPQYVVGDEIKLRKFEILTANELSEVLCEISENYCSYSRPFSTQELEEFLYLYKNNYYAGNEICCKDNIFALLDTNINFAKMLDKKDVVKYSIFNFGEQKNFYEVWTDLIDEETDKIKYMLSVVRDCPLSKKQAKYYNKLLMLAGTGNMTAESNAKSPYKLALAKMNAGDVVGAAEVFAKSGSLLERNLKMLLSRADAYETKLILEMVKADNPIVLSQLVSGILNDTDEARIFSFTHNRRLKSHVETEYETKWRKSRLSAEKKELVSKICKDKIYSYYAEKLKLGDVYIADNFYKLAPPINTSATGKGIDTVPAGSRIAVKSPLIRTFVYWKDAFDIDAHLTLIKDNGSLENVGFYNYSERMSDSIRFSGDCRAKDGAEYFDLNLDLLKKNGYKYVIMSFYGFCSRLDEGEIYCGYQAKQDFMTEVWDPKNIAMQFKVYGDTRGCVGFGFDLDTLDLVMLNQMVDTDDRVINKEDLAGIIKMLNAESLAINIGSIVSAGNQQVLFAEDADVVFDDTYEAKEGQTVIRSWEIEKLVKLVNI